MKNRSLKIGLGATILLIARVISACSQPGISPTAHPAVPFLDIFPVYPGTNWTYERIDYDRYLDQTFTATYQISETVNDAQVKGSYYIAHLKGKKSLLAKDAGWTSPDDSKTYDFWYVLHAGLVFKTQQAPDLANLADINFDLVYRLPLVVNAAWCPGLENLKSGLSCKISSLYTVLDMKPYQSKAGNFDGCYQIRQFFNTGSFFNWFCRGIGPVGKKFDHGGTPFGYNETLISFTRGEVPAGFTIQPFTPPPTD